MKDVLNPEFFLASNKEVVVGNDLLIGHFNNIQY